MWGSPDRCEKVAKSLKLKATLLGQAMAIDAPAVDQPAPTPEPAPTPSPTSGGTQSNAANPPAKTTDGIDSVLSTAPPTPDQPPAPKP